MAGKKAEEKKTEEGKGGSSSWYAIDSKPISFEVLDKLPVVEGRPNIGKLEKNKKYQASPMGGANSFYYQVEENGAVIDTFLINEWTKASLIKRLDSKATPIEPKVA